MVGKVGIMRKLEISWQTQLEPKLEMCLTILDREVETGLARITGPDLGYLTETVEEECRL